MDDQTLRLIASLETAWAENGFLQKVREGHFKSERGEEFLNFLLTLEIKPDQLLDKRFVSLIWYVPLFLTWQTERVIKNGGNAAAYERFNNHVLEAVENILGVP